MPDDPSQGAEQTIDLARMRVIYTGGALDESDLVGTWHEQFARWLDDAVTAGIPEPNAMVLATTDTNGLPSTRTVLAKGLDSRGVVFYTNLTSAKMRDLSVSRFAAVTFPWIALHRQVHLRGSIETLSRQDTMNYWQTRPRGAQLGAWASPQSTVVADREALDTALRDIATRFADAAEVPLPPHWGGVRILPVSVEFWQGRLDRMHDRLRYRRIDDGQWRVERLAP